MIKSFLLTICLSTATILCQAQDSLQATIILIGDAGQLTGGVHPVTGAVRKNIPLTKNTSVIYLGDNLYKTGLPDESLPNYAIAKASLDSQIILSKGTDAKVYFIPGNHDWANGGANGYESIKRIDSYISFLGGKNVEALPDKGCPGPVAVEVNENITMVLMDSQWWLHEEDKPGIESDCPTKTKDEVISELDDVLSKNSKKLIILATHHPFKSYGPHGGYFTLKQHIFPFTDIKPGLYIPLPVIGSAYPLTRAVFGTLQDLKHPLYQSMISKISAVVKEYKNVIYVAGHEHTIQLIQDSNFNYIVSGSGSKSSRVSKGPGTLYATSSNGFVTLDIYKNKDVIANVYTVSDSGFKKDFTQNILNFSTIDLPDAPDTMRKAEYVYKDRVVISASDAYKNPRGFRKLMIGTNYREAWGVPVDMREFNINKDRGGLKAKSLGGGKQTRSLKLEDKRGHEWSLRSIDKDPEKAVPENLRGTIAQDIVQDVISASHPYAPLTVPTLAKAVGVLQGDPELVFVPNDPALGIYQKTYANTVAMLEDRDPTPDRSETKSTASIIDNLLDDNDNHIVQEKVLTARILDNLIGDFDRHADQWKWATTDTGKGKLYYPVPRDRDQAYFNSNGLFVKLVSFVQFKYLSGFKKNINDVNRFYEVAKDFDRFFLNGLDERAWDSTLTQFQANTTDQVIEQAIQKLPKEVYAIDGAELITKLKSRRDDIKREGMKYYHFLSQKVYVTGSNKKEFFHVTNNGGNVKVTVYKKTDETDSVKTIYERTFVNGKTKEIVLYGFNGEDKFVVDDDVDSRMIIRFVGGKGEDTFSLGGNTKKFVYDLRQEKNDIQRIKRGRSVLSYDPAVLNFENNFKYNRFIFPGINIGFNAEDGLLLGIKATSERHGFRRDPYKSLQKLGVLTAPSRDAYQVSYSGTFIKAILKRDLVINARYIGPTLNNYFGSGNETVFDNTKPLSFYRTRFQQLDADVLLRRRLGKVAAFSYGPSFYQYDADYDDNKFRLIGDKTLFDSASIFSKKQYAGGKIRFDAEYIDNPLYPKRGITWYNAFTGLKSLQKDGKSLLKATTDMTVYANVTGSSTVTAILRAGGGRIFSKNAEYFQLLNLGANNFNRGFRKNRFAGDGLLYGGFETRLKLFKSRSYILPGDVGLVGYYDIGRVWLRGENSKKWHDSYGGGIFLAPFNAAMIMATVGISPEDKLFNFTLGSKINLTF